jgi:uncharacterized membrane protein
LIIENVTPEDDKEFKTIFCAVEAGVGGAQTETEKATTFTVVVYPDSSPVVALDREVFSMGENILVGTCKSGEGHPKPTISFLKNGVGQTRELDPFADFTSDDIAVVGSDGFSLSMKTSLVAPELTAEDDGAVFTCVADVNGVTTQTDFPPIRVNYPTNTVTVTASQNPVNDGSTVTLSCAANGFPDASITQFGEGDSATLEITVSKADNGRAVTCFAANSGNTDPVASAAYVINVNYVDTPVTSGDVTVGLGDPIAPTCTVDATAPGAATAWSKDGVAVELPIAATFASAGTYTCTASAAGLPSTSADAAVVVEGMELQSTGEDVVVGEDGAATLSCTAAAVPVASISWQLTDKEGVITDIVDGVTDTTDGISVTSTLALSKVDSKLSQATIACTASNGAVSQTASYTMPEIKTGGTTGIIIGILIGLLVLAIVLYILYSRGIICKEEEKEGVEDGKEDIEIGQAEEGAAAGEADAVQTEEEKEPLTNGDGAK